MSNVLEGRPAISRRSRYRDGFFVCFACVGDDRFRDEREIRSGRHEELVVDAACVRAAAWIRLESSVGAFAVHAAAFAGFALLVNAMVVLRPFMRGGMAFAVFCVVMILVQKKNSIVEAPHRD